MSSIDTGSTQVPAPSKNRSDQHSGQLNVRGSPNGSRQNRPLFSRQSQSRESVQRGETGKNTGPDDETNHLLQAPTGEAAEPGRSDSEEKL